MYDKVNQQHKRFPVSLLLTLHCFIRQNYNAVVAMDKSLAILLFFVATCAWAKTSFGPCPKHDVVTNFDLSKYIGK